MRVLSWEAENSVRPVLANAMRYTGAVCPVNDNTSIPLSTSHKTTWVTQALEREVGVTPRAKLHCSAKGTFLSIDALAKREQSGEKSTHVMPILCPRPRSGACGCQLATSVSVSVVWRRLHSCMQATLLC